MSKNMVTQEHVQARVDDWIRRVQHLYAEIKDWVKAIDGLQFEERQNATMYEELMQRFGIDPQPMPTLDLYEGGDLIARVKPIGLWIIGANGRVDLMLRHGGIQLVDESEQFQNAKWVAHDREHFMEGQLLTKELFLHLLGVKSHECV